MLMSMILKKKYLVFIIKTSQMRVELVHRTEELYGMHNDFHVQIVLPKSSIFDPSF